MDINFRGRVRGRGGGGVGEKDVTGDANESS